MAIKLSSVAVHVGISVCPIFMANFDQMVTINHKNMCYSPFRIALTFHAPPFICVFDLLRSAFSGGLSRKIRGQRGWICRVF